MTRNEKTAAIRAELKKRGWNSRQVSVRGRPCTYSSSIDVVIKDARVPLKVVEKIANSYESVRRCEVTGDILMGGNTYVSVDYDSDALKPYVEAVLAKLGDSEYLETCGYVIAKEKNGNGIGGPDDWWYSRHDEHTVHRAWNKECAVQGMVRDLLSRGE
jgi:hypothetical protein